MVKAATALQSTPSLYSLQPDEDRSHILQRAFLPGLSPSDSFGKIHTLDSSPLSMRKVKTRQKHVIRVAFLLDLPQQAGITRLVNDRTACRHLFFASRCSLCNALAGSQKLALGEAGYCWLHQLLAASMCLVGPSIGKILETAFRNDA